MRTLTVVIFVAVVILGPARGAEAMDSLQSFDVRVAAEHVVPEAEKHIHIGGGFFSHFDDCMGIIHIEGSGTGTVRFRLERLGWESPYVYLPAGDCRLDMPDGSTVVMRMSRLDYVNDPETGRLVYRLTLESAEGHGVLTGDCADPEGAARPVLEGTFSAEIGGQVTSAAYRMCGRGEAEAERHLNRVVHILSDFEDCAL